MDGLRRQGGQFQQMPGHIEDVHPDVFWWRTIPQDLETILKEMKTDHSALSKVKFLLLGWLGAQNRIKLYYRKIVLCAVLAWRPSLRYVHLLSENAGIQEDRGTKSVDLLESHWVLPGAGEEAPRVHSVFPALLTPIHTVSNRHWALTVKHRQIKQEWKEEHFQILLQLSLILWALSHAGLLPARERQRAGESPAPSPRQLPPPCSPKLQAQGHYHHCPP